MTRQPGTSDRGDVACHLCFRDKVLQNWIKEESERRGPCVWCGGRSGYLIPLQKLAEPFREVTSLYVPVEGPDAYDRGEWISFLLDEGWGLFSERLQDRDNAQKLTVSILYADLSGKERFECPDYEGFFNYPASTLEEDWNERACAVLNGDMPDPSKEGARKIEQEIGAGLPSPIELAFEDLTTHVPAGRLYYRARVHDDRGRKTGLPSPRLARRQRTGRGPGGPTARPNRFCILPQMRIPRWPRFGHGGALPSLWRR